MKEQELLQLIHAFVISRLTYALPYLRLLVCERDRVDRLIRKVYKTALGLVRTTSTSHLLSLGIHNTIDELIEAHRTAQIQRLRGSKTGRWILARISISASPSGTDPVSIPPPLRRRFFIKPLPKNMLAGHHDGRRRARAQALCDAYASRTDAAYVDVARYPTQPSNYALSVMATRTPIDANAVLRVAGSVRALQTAEAEEAAIALAVSSGFTTILSDSKTAIAHFARGTVAPGTLRILRSLAYREDEDQIPISLVWVPAHAGNPGNEAAHWQAREFVNRAMSRATDPKELGEPLTSYHEIAQHYRLARRTKPPPHPKLTKPQEIAWRRLQTNSFPCPQIYTHIYPDLFSLHCSQCGSVASLSHILWDCSEDPPPPDLLTTPSPEACESVHRNPSLEIQLRAVQCAEEVAARHSLTAIPL
uniref:Tick transposon n=1 Tax=Rhipicephalus zambeziensis TaxID=60191 RepID=A0A224Z9T6_9ACAR